MPRTYSFTSDCCCFDDGGSGSGSGLVITRCCPGGLPALLRFTLHNISGCEVLDGLSGQLLVWPTANIWYSDRIGVPGMPDLEIMFDFSCFATGDLPSDCTSFGFTPHHHNPSSDEIHPEDIDNPPLFNFWVGTGSSALVGCSCSPPLFSFEGLQFDQTFPWHLPVPCTGTFGATITAS